MIRSSLHNHCTLCDGKSTLEEMIAAAKAAGITDLGISCHAYAPFDLSASVKSESEYIRTVTEAKEKCEGISLYLGTEYDIYSTVADLGAYDYFIGACHYIRANGKYYAVDSSLKEQYDCINEAFGGDARAYIEAYFNGVVAAARLRPSFLAHLDLITKYDAEFIKTQGDVYRDFAFSAIDECIKCDTVFELNYGAVSRGHRQSPYPSEEILRRIIERGGRITVGTDCHNAAFVAYGLSEAPSYLRSLGCKAAVVLRGGRWTEERI